MSIRLALLPGIALGLATASAASPVFDPVGDFLPTYLGPKSADLDIVRTDGVFNNQTFNFTATMAGAIGTTAGGFYVIGINRGAGTARFGALAPNLLFDSIINVNNDGTGFIRDLVTGVRTDLASDAIVIGGATFSVRIGAAQLPSEGLLPADYTFALWPRSPGAGVNTIADFSPGNGTRAIDAVPEPATWMLMLAGLGAAGFALRRRGSTLSPLNA